MDRINTGSREYIASKRNLYRRYIKKGLDRGLALFLLVPSVPLVLIGALLMRIDSNGPVFFAQERIGKNCRRFTICKLRTMRCETRGKDGSPLKDKDRIGLIGRLIRKSSIDELPQLLNILKGEMSFIGPRPLLVRYLPYYTDKEIRRHDVLPGITGLAQVNGRYRLKWEERFALDVEYAENISTLLDLKIFLKTIGKVVTGTDAAAAGTAGFPDLDEYRGFRRVR